MVHRLRYALTARGVAVRSGEFVRRVPRREGVVESAVEREDDDFDAKFISSTQQILERKPKAAVREDDRDDVCEIWSLRLVDVQPRRGAQLTMQRFGIECNPTRRVREVPRLLTKVSDVRCERNAGLIARAPPYVRAALRKQREGRGGAAHGN